MDGHHRPRPAPLRHDPGRADTRAGQVRRRHRGGTAVRPRWDTAPPRALTCSRASPSPFLGGLAPRDGGRLRGARATGDGVVDRDAAADLAYAHADLLADQVASSGVR